MRTPTSVSIINFKKPSVTKEELRFGHGKLIFTRTRTMRIKWLVGIREAKTDNSVI